MALLNPGGAIAQFQRNDCSISPVEVIWRGGVRKTLKTSGEYKYAIETAKKITAMCAVIKAKQTSKEVKEEKVKNTDSADQYGEISKIFELKEKGIITEEEFNMKKKQLLGL